MDFREIIKALVLARRTARQNNNPELVDFLGHIIREVAFAWSQET